MNEWYMAICEVYKCVWTICLICLAPNWHLFWDVDLPFYGSSKIWVIWVLGAYCVWASSSRFCSPNTHCLQNYEVVSWWSSTDPWYPNGMRFDIHFGSSMLTRFIAITHASPLITLSKRSQIAYYAILWIYDNHHIYFTINLVVNF